MPIAHKSANVVKIGKIPFRATTLESAVAEVLTAARDRQATSVRLANAYCVALASKEPDYANLLNESGINYPDGAPVAWFIRRYSRNKKARRVRGPSLFESVLASSAKNNLSNFFLGTTDATLKALTASIIARNPDIEIAGTYAPPFAPVDEQFLQQCAIEIEKTSADIVWIGLGTPKQDFVATALSARTNKMCIGVGAAFDFAAGTTAQAPSWIQSSGFEWLYRFASEPRRLWRRYIFGNSRFLYSALIETKQGR